MVFCAELVAGWMDAGMALITRWRAILRKLFTLVESLILASVLPRVPVGILRKKDVLGRKGAPREIVQFLRNRPVLQASRLAL